MQKIYAFCVHTIEYLCAGLFTVLAIASFLKTASVKNAYEIVIRLTWDNPLVNISFLILSLGIFLFVGKLLEQKKYGAQTLLILTCIWVFCASMLWTYFSKSGPASDCGSVYYAAKQFAKNDFSALAYRDSYFSVYPFQLGLALFYELIFRIAGSDNFHILQGVNALCLVMIVISQYHITGLFFQKKKAQIYGLLLTAFCIPLIMYGSYIYGEIPSFAFLLFGFWMLLLFLERHHVLHGILAFCSIGCCILIRQNNYIFLIALGIITILFFWNNWNTLSKKMRILLPIYFVCLFALSLQIIPIVQSSYSQRSQTEINKGVPTSTYLAMGLMESEAGPGYYNGFNFETFTVDADYDYDRASDIGFKTYYERLQVFAQNPSYAFNFFTTKWMNQWLNVGWAVFNSTYVSFGERLPIIESCFSGPLYKILIDYMSGFQFVLYLFTAVGCIFQIKQNKHLFSYTFLLTALGGFLFYMMWEASGRYILPYGIFIFPNAAYGCFCLLNMMERKIVNLKGKKYVK